MRDDPVNGDPVCWLDRLCPECRAVPADGATNCWRCGAPLPARDPAEPPGVE